MAVFFNINGIGFKGGRVRAVEAGIIGFYHDGRPWKPNRADVRPLIPTKWLPAFERASLWWVADDDDATARMDLYDRRGRLLTQIFAHAGIDE